MSTPKQIAANRTNACKSTGPTTAAGKQAVSVNALRHGLTGRTVVIPSDDLDHYKTHVKAITSSLNPESPEEIQLASLIADDYWRLQRVKSIEDGIFALQYAENETLANQPQANATLNAAKAYLDHSKELERLTLYESRIQRNIKSATARLEKLQSDRRAARAKALEQAALLTRLARSNKTTYAPPEETNGFDFSPSEIDRAIQLQQARHLPKPQARAA